MQLKQASIVKINKKLENFLKNKSNLEKFKAIKTNDFLYDYPNNTKIIKLMAFDLKNIAEILNFTSEIDLNEGISTEPEIS